MNHLTDEQLSALLDGALSAAERTAAGAHLADCDACRARLADAEALDDSLERSLTHDPGDAYFESFAARVAERIAGAGAPQPARAAAAKSPWRWLLSPRGLSLAGSTAALLLVAGLAWVRFHERGGTVADLRSAPPSPVGSSLREEGAREAAPAVPQADATGPAASSAPAPGEPAPGTSARSEQVRVQEQPARMQQMEKSASGEDVPVGAAAPVAPPPAAAGATTLGRMKQRGAAPASGETALQLQAAPPPAAPQAATAKRAPAATSNEAPAARSATPAPSEALSGATAPGDAVSRAPGTAAALAPCGTVRDSHGRAVAGAQVVVVNDVTRSARTGPDGAFCLSRLEPGDELSVLRVGFEPVRVTVGTSAPVAVVMEPVGTLGPEPGQALVPPRTATAPGLGWSTAPGKPAGGAASAPDVYATQAPPVRDSVAAAREAARVARRDRDAAALDAAARRWDAIAAMVTGAALHDARFQALTLRRGALSAGPTPERLTRFRADLRTYLAQAPRDRPEYETALLWQGLLETGNKSLYR